MKKLTFSEELKSELVNLKIDRKYFHYEIFGFIKAKGKLIINKYEENLSLVLSSPYTTRRFKMLMNVEGEKSEILCSMISRLGRKSYMILVQIRDITEFLRKYNLHLDDPNFLPKMSPPAFKNFIRGMFLASGSVSDPRKYYSLEIFMTEGGAILGNIATTLSDLLKIKVGVLKGSTGRRKRLYIKSGIGVAKFIEFIGASKSARKYMSLIKQRKIKSDVFRTVNFISANAKRVVISSKKQVEVIKYIDKMIGIEALPEDLKEVALLRVENMELSLKEIAERLGLSSKSVVQNRMRKLERLAKILKAEDT